MPVVLQPVTAPSEQDLLDLGKIYNDYPSDLQWPELQQQLENQPETTLYGALFNGRLIGALTVTDQGDSAELDHLCVRSVTRRRGVGREMIRQLLTKTAFASFTLHTDSNNEALQAFLNHTGFQQNGNCFRLNRAT